LIGTVRTAQVTSPKKTFSQFNQVITAFIEHQSPLLKRLPWLHTGNNNVSLPFVQKIVVNPSSHIFLCGDIHGDLESCVKIILRLKNNNHLNNQLQITDPHTYLIVLGDFVGRGSNSIGVLTVLLKLAMQNPGHVFLLKGNHEDIAMTRSNLDRFLTEILETYDRSEHAVQEILISLEALYSLFPVALYCGFLQADGSIEFLHLSHAAFDIGYNPRPLLEDRSPTICDRITALPRAEYLAAILQCHSAHQDNGRQLSIDPQAHATSFASISESVFLEHANSEKQHLVFGFTWGNFIDHASGTQCDPYLKSFVYYAQPFFDTVFAHFNEGKHKFIAVIRGHQHNKSLEPLFAYQNNGLFVFAWSLPIVTLISSGNLLETYRQPASEKVIANFAEFYLTNNHLYQLIQHTLVQEKPETECWILCWRFDDQTEEDEEKKSPMPPNRPSSR
jgi:hypothetical protein